MRYLKDLLDAQLSKVTMYRLVTLCLGVLLGVAALLSFTGYFAFSLIMSVALLLASTYGSSRLFGYLFSVRPHGESSIITALILACLFIPPTDAAGFVKLVLVAVFATASKYLFAIRGRHIFNPAAIATVIASITGVAFAGWWIATPALLPVTIVIALLILYKTSRLQVGLIFMILALILVTIQSVLLGITFAEGIWIAVASWPIIFLGGVMLSEPLTMPPRRWQQITIATVVACLLIVPLKLPFLLMTPALALVIGNLIGWYWGTRRAITLKFIQRAQLTPSSYEFIFEGTAPFTAGQYIELTLPHKNADSRGMRRVFTIAASPGDKTVRFGIKIAEKSSTFKQVLMDLQPGKIVQATRVAGDFVLPNDTTRPLLFVAGGIGITPLISYLRAYKNRDITLVYAVSSPEEIAYRDVIAVSGIKVIIVTSGTPEHLPGGWKVVNDSRVTGDLLKREIKDIQKRDVYISGPPLMVNAVKRAAKDLGAKRVKTDQFAGY